MNLLEVLLKNSQDYIYYKDKELRFVKLNEKAAWALGASSPEDALGKTDFDYFPDIADQTQADELHIMQTGQPQLNEEMQITFADGSKHWMSVSKMPYYDKEGNVQGIVGISRDITKTKQMELQNQHKTGFLQSILDTSPNCMYVKDREGRYIIANNTIAALYQTTPEQMIGKTDADFANQSTLQPNEADYFTDIDKKAIETKETQIIPSESFTYDDGTTHYFYTTKTPITYQNNPDCVLGISIDITKLKETEIKIKESEEKFRQTFQHSTVGYSLTNIDGTLCEVNAAFATMLGYSTEELSKMKFKDITYPEDLAESQECVRDLLSKEKTTYRFQKRYVHKNGSIVWTDVSTTLLKDINNEPLFFITSIVDITQQKKTEISLQETLKATTDGIWMWNFKTNDMFFSDRYYQMLGYEPQEFEATYDNWLNLIHPDDKEKTLAVAEEYLKTKPGLYKNVFRLRTKQGTYRWFQSKARVVERDDNGEAVRMIGNHEDITTQKETERKLKESEERYQLALDATKDGIYDWNLLTNEIYYSPRWKGMLGYEDDELPNDFSTWENLTDPEDAKKSWEMQNELINKKRDRFELVFKMKHKEGYWVPILSRAKAVFDDQGKAVRLVGTHIDISENRQLETKIQRIFDMSTELICEADINTATFTTINPAFLRILGYNEEELLSKSFLEFIHPDDIQPTQNIIDEQLKKGEKVLSFINRYRCKDGSYVWLDWNSLPIPEEGIIYAVARDITEQRNAEKILKESEERYRFIFENTPIGITTADKKGRIIDINQAGADITGHSREELIGKSYKELHFIDKKNILSILKEFSKILKGKTLGPLEVNVTDLKGNNHIVEVRITPTKDENSKFTGSQITMHDVTYRRTAENKVLESESKYRALFESAPDGIFLADEHGRYLQVNKAASQITGYSQEELQQMCIPDVIPEDQREKAIKHFITIKEQGHASADIPFKRKDGSLGWWSINAVKLTDKLFLGYTKDITTSKQHELLISQQNEELKKMNKLKSDFLNITSHELRTPMTAMKGYLEMIRHGTLQTTEEQHQAIDIILRNTNRLDRLVDDILDTSRLESGTMKFLPQETDINQLIEDTTNIMSSDAEQKHINITTHVDPTLPTITLDPDRVKQVLNNLVKNAIKFSPEHSTITISAKPYNQYVLFKIQDQGRGIPSSCTDKIFEVFYQVDSGVDRSYSGTGLGLTICRGIALGHGGDIWVESEEGKGSTFFFTIPLQPVLDAEGTFQKLDVFNVEKQKKPAMEIEE